MRLKRLDIRGFGQLSGIVDLETGPSSIALLLARNEAGKSTLASAITAALFGLDGNRTRHRKGMTPLERFKPWGGGNYGLELLLDRAGRELRITRDFEQGTTTVHDGTRDITQEFRRGKEVEVGEQLTGLTRVQFALSAFVPQGQIVWDNPSALSEALQRVADSQGGENTAAEAIEVLQSGLDQYSGLMLKSGKVQTEIKRCQEEATKACAQLDELDSRRAELDQQIDRLRQLESESDEARIRRDALRLRRAATDLDFEREALAADDQARARREELVQTLAADPTLERITETVRRDLQARWRRHGMLESDQGKFLGSLESARTRCAKAESTLGAEALQQVPTREQVDELGAWCHAYRDLLAERQGLAAALENEHAKVRAAGFDPVRAEHLATRFGKVDERGRAFLAGLRKQRMDLDDQDERLQERRAAASGELTEVEQDRERRRQRAIVLLSVGSVLAVGGWLATRFIALPAWAGPIPGALIAILGGYLVIGVAGHRSGAESAARLRLDGLGEERQRLDEARYDLQDELDVLAAGIHCSAAELEETWQAWLDLQPHTSGQAVLSERLAHTDHEEARLAAGLESIAPLLGRRPTLDEIDDLYESFKRARASADELTAARSESETAERESRQSAIQVEESVQDLRAQLRELGVELEDDTPLQQAFDRFDERIGRAVDMARIREAELPQLERQLADPQQRARRELRVTELTDYVQTTRSHVEQGLTGLGADGQAQLATLDDPLTEDQLKSELVQLEGDIERRHEASTRQLTEVRSFVERYEREAPVLREQIEELERAARRAGDFAAAVELARDTLDELAQQTHQVWSRELATQTNRTLAAMGSDIGEVTFDDDLNLSLVQRGRRMSGNDTGQALSTGARDLLHLACRLALSNFLSGGGIDLPLILDDPFAHCDDARTIDGMTVLLDSIAPAHQVILLACQRSRYDWVRERIEGSGRIRPLILENGA
ncbi:hypothetical protein DRQ32_01525 [bacterium]|nr:MAG: hypothetical protein DRQ32_01525 [bacterium]